MAKERLFTSEADLVAAFCGRLDPALWERNPAHAPKWIQYHETAGWDLLLAHPSGTQIGIEAKLTLNAKVLEQALPKTHYSDPKGPDYRAVLVPSDGLQNHLQTIAHHLGIVVIELYGRKGGGRVGGRWINEAGPWIHDFRPNLPDGTRYGQLDWPNWCPAERCKLPDYVPDVTGGHAAPLKLSEWKIAAIKLLLILERRGSVTRRDMKQLGISPTRWTERRYGFLSPSPIGYVRNDRTPDLRAQHPTNWAEIEADMPRWAAGFDLTPVPTQQAMVA